MAANKRRQLSTWVGLRGSEQLINCIENPSDSEILQELRDLPGGDQVTSVELRISKTDYLAVGGSIEDGYSAGFQEFSKGGRYESVEENLALDDAGKIMVSYRDGTDFWRSAVSWERVKIKDQLAAANEEEDRREANHIASWVVNFIAGLFGSGRK